MDHPDFIFDVFWRGQLDLRPLFRQRGGKSKRACFAWLFVHGCSHADRHDLGSFKIQRWLFYACEDLEAVRALFYWLDLFADRAMHRHS